MERGREDFHMINRQRRILCPNCFMKKKMNIVYGFTKIDVDMMLCAKNVGHGNSKDCKEVNDYIKVLK